MRSQTVLKILSAPAGLAKLKEAQGGQAVRLLEQSKTVANGAIPLAAAYNKAEPSTPAAEHAEFGHDLRICVDSALARVRFTRPDACASAAGDVKARKIGAAAVRWLTLN